MQTFLQDLRFGFRMLRRTPGFSVLAILCLTLGIGTNAAALSWIEGILIRPYPLVAHQDRMFALNCTTRGAQGFTGLSYPDFLDLEKNSTLFESFIVDKITGTTLSNGDRAERAVGGMVSANYFDALGVRPILGRGFRSEEGTGRNAHPVTVISYMTWKNRYKGDPDIIGKTQYMNGVQHTIIGVAPERFHGTFIGYSFNFWLPTSMQETFDNTGYKLEDRGARWIEGYAFLKPGVTQRQAQAELSAIAKRLENDYPQTDRGHEVGLLPLWKTPFNAAGGISTTLGITAAAVLLLSVAICVGSTMLFALMPAIQSSHVDLSGALKSEGAGVVGGSGRSRLRSALVLVQVSLSFVLLAGTGLLLQSLQRMQNTSPGFFTNNAMVAVVDLFSAGYKLDRAKIFHTQLLDRVRALPGVESAALTRVMPFSYNPPSSAPIEIDGYQQAPDEQPNADYVQVSEDYFSTLGIPLVAGREFTRNDDENSPRVAIINETMAAKYWPGKDPIGQRLKVKDTWMQIVGVAKNVYYETKLEAPRSFFYVPVRQNFFVGNTLLIRTREAPAAITNALAREFHALDPTLAPYAADRLREAVDQRGYTQRLAVTLLAIFGGMALFLAAIGLYGVMSYSVSQSTRELGVRMALGAGVRDVLRLVMSRGLRLIIAGVVVGAAVALLLTRLMGNLLYKVSPRDPIAFGAALIILIAVALVACFVPARRATRIDPVQALRS